jgi:alcohol dehydrogenase class IV
MPANLAEMGVTEAMIPGIAELAVADHCTATNPRPAGVEDYVALLHEAMG